jgi:hypothetical protein
MRKIIQQKHIDLAMHHEDLKEDLYRHHDLLQTSGVVCTVYFWLVKYMPRDCSLPTQVGLYVIVAKCPTGRPNSPRVLLG